MSYLVKTQTYEDMTQMIESVTIIPSDIPTGHAAFDALASLPTGRLGYALARNAAELRRADRTLQEAQTNVLHAHAWTHLGDVIYACADKRFKPELYAGNRTDMQARNLEIQDDLIYSDEGHYWLGDEDLGIIQAIEGRVYLRDPIGYKQQAAELEKASIDIQLTLIEAPILSEVEGITQVCFWLPMLK